MRTLCILIITVLFFTAFKSLNNPTHAKEYSKKEADVLFSKINNWEIPR